MKALIVSDTHGHDNTFLNIARDEKPLDLIIHLGDIEGLADYIEQVTDTPCYAVRGNNDLGSPLPAESVIMLGRHKVFITHGHLYGVGYSLSEIKHYARGIDCDTIMYGHTHYPQIETEGDLTIINPGSLTYPRQPGRKPSYIVADVNADGEVSYSLKYVEKN